MDEDTMTVKMHKNIVDSLQNKHEREVSVYKDKIELQRITIVQLSGALSNISKLLEQDEYTSKR